MATASFKGVLFIADSYHNGAINANAQIYSIDGIPGNPKIPVSQLYIWEQSTEWVFQFRVSLNASNLNQRNFRTLANGGNCGVAAGAFTLTLTNVEYLVFPISGLGYFDQTANALYVQIRANKGFIKAAPAS